MKALKASGALGSPLRRPGSAARRHRRRLGSSTSPRPTTTILHASHAELAFVERARCRRSRMYAALGSRAPQVAAPPQLLATRNVEHRRPLCAVSGVVVLCVPTLRGARRRPVRRRMRGSTIGRHLPVASACRPASLSSATVTFSSPPRLVVDPEEAAGDDRSLPLLWQFRQALLPARHVCVISQAAVAAVCRLLRATGLRERSRQTARCRCEHDPSAGTESGTNLQHRRRRCVRRRAAHTRVTALENANLAPSSRAPLGN